MNFTEIERKFLVAGEFRQFATAEYRICQGYLSSDPQRTVRVRIKGDKGYLTIKGASTADGLSRFEWEKEIAVSEAEMLLKLCLPGAIEKTRYIVPFGGLTFEVDEFFGENAGLVMAEVELESATQQVSLPEWLGQEVTGDKRYYNSYLSQRPFSKW
ncbi:MAG: CYTH domain-containing protein [Salinivirgaceae bacterium]|nr:CYTH domain-containing protein [Salinivirgaceae bacterium]